MKCILCLVVLFSVASLNAKSLSVSCRQVDNSKVGGTYYEATISDKNQLSNVKMIDVTGAKSTILSSAKGPFVGKQFLQSKEYGWRTYMVYNNVTAGDCRRDDCISLVLPPSMAEQLGRRFGGLAIAKDDHRNDQVSIVCQVY